MSNRFSGRVVGIRAHYSPRHHPETGELLQSYWQNGNVDERRETVTIRARQGVILASGGHAGNPQVRSMFPPGHAGARLPDERRRPAGAARPGRQRAGRRPAGRRQPRRDAAEPVVPDDVPHLDPPRHPGCLHDDDARAPHVRLPRLGRGQRRQRRLRGVHRGKPGREAVLQRGPPARQTSRQPVPRRRRLPRPGARPQAARLAQLPEGVGPADGTTTTTASTPPWP